MGITVNLSLIVMATIVAVCAIHYFCRETGSRRNRILMLVMGIFTCIWCMGYALMGFSKTESLAYIWRAVGLVGINFFMISALTFVLYISDAFPRFRRLIVFGFILLGLVDTALFASPDSVSFLLDSERTRYYGTMSAGRNLHYVFLGLLFFSTLALEIRWYRRARLKRDKYIIITLIIVNFILGISYQADTVLPLFGVASFPGSCYGAFICYMAIWFISTQLNAFSISVLNLSNYIYQYVNSSILIFDNDLKLAMANNFAYQFLKIDADAHPTLPELFQISKEDAKTIYEELIHDIAPSDLRLISKTNQALCTIKMDLFKDSFGDPYCLVCFVLDLTREEKILHEVNEMKDKLQADLKEKTYQVESLTLQSITNIANTIDARDAYSKGHGSRVSEYSALLAQAIGWNKEAVQNLKYIALLHDIGTVSVPDSILNKPEALTKEEYEIIKSHTTVGADILKDMSMIKGVDLGAKYHHERYDGNGYPEGLAGEDIPLVARIIGITDAYDAMSSKRIYRGPLSPEQIRGELITGRGTQFDPALLDRFVELLDNGELARCVQTEAGSENTIAEESSKLLDQILTNLEEEKERNNQRDYLTGLLNRKSGEIKIIEAMQEAPGALAFVDLDNLKVINDTLGHLSGDHAIRILSEVLQAHSHNAIIARVGGDEFLYYMQKVDEKEARAIIEGIIRSFRSEKENDEILKVSSLSIGLCLTTPADAYSEVYQKADKALYYVKQNGKDGYYFYNYSNRHTDNMTPVDLKRLVFSISKQGAYQGSLGVEYREFAKFYEYIHHLVDRYEKDLQLIMLTLEPKHPDSFPLEEQEKAMAVMSSSINRSLRNVDISTRFSSEQFLIILLDANIENIQLITKRIFDHFYKMYTKDNITLTYDVADLPIQDFSSGGQ